MARYAVGDLQGCLAPLQRLLETVAFDPAEDQLWLVGDLINRGPASLQTLRFIIELGNCTRVVLGNHDLHFLAVAYGAENTRPADTLDELLESGDLKLYRDWLRQQPLLYSDPSGDYSMVHAGIPPQWTLQQALSLSAEVEALLRSDRAADFFTHMYGNQPDCWDEQLQGWDRYRLITNYLTRIRFCNAEGKLDLENKTASSADTSFKAWFSHPRRKTAADNIVFGHWAALQGKTDTDAVFAVDTGCVWGGCLTMMNLETRERHSTSCEGALS